MNTTPRTPMEAARRYRKRCEATLLAATVIVAMLCLLAFGFYITRGAVDDERIKPNATPAKTLT